MAKRRRYKQVTSLKERLAEEARRLRKQAQDTPPGFERELLVRKAQRSEAASQMRSEAASQMIEWLTSAPGNQDRIK
jgi:hypothetical protein